MMNEKFMELADQLKWESDVNYGELMRFAALIVSECADIAHYLAPSDESAAEVRNGIKQHFGLK